MPSSPPSIRSIPSEGDRARGIFDSRGIRRIPRLAQSLLHKNPALPAIAANIGWLFADKMARMVGGLVLTIWLARYLGPEEFGEYSYIIAFIAVFTPIASLGLGDVVVRDLVQSPDTTTSTLGTAFTLELIGGVLAAALSIFAVFYVRPGHSTIQLMVTLLAITLVIKATEVIKYWYQSRVQSRQTIVIETSLFIVFLLIKIALILSKCPLEYFILALVAEALCVAVGLCMRYAMHTGLKWRWHTHWSRAKTFLADSWPLIFSGGFVLLNMNADKVMLGSMRGDVEIGYFTAAVRLTEAWYFVPVIVGASAAPHLIQLFHKNPAAYHRAAQTIFNALSALAICVCIGASFLSSLIIPLLYGSSYEAAIPVLIIHIWSSLFVFHASLRTQLLVIENKAGFVFIFSALALAANIAINIVLIPKLGAVGASWASLISWMSCVLVFPLLFARTRSFPLQFFFISPGRFGTHA